MILAAGIALAVTVTAQPTAVPPGSVVLMVMDCGTATPPIDIEVNGKPLTLIPPAARDDSIELCYEATLALPSTVHVRLRRGGTERAFDLKLEPRTKAVAISASDMTARAWSYLPGID